MVYVYKLEGEEGNMNVWFIGVKRSKDFYRFFNLVVVCDITYSLLCRALENRFVTS